VRVKVKDKKTGVIAVKTLETVTGRVIFNQVMPEEVGFVDELLTKKKLQGIIADVIKLPDWQRRLSSWMISRSLVSRWHIGEVCR